MHINKTERTKLIHMNTSTNDDDAAAAGTLDVGHVLHKHLVTQNLKKKGRRRNERRRGRERGKEKRRMNEKKTYARTQLHFKMRVFIATV